MPASIHVSASPYREVMDRNVNSFDALYTEAGDHRPLMPWDELLAFVRRFPQLAAFNAALIAQQRGSARFVETEEAWLHRFERRLKDDAEALVILHPFAPVKFVYDIADTFGPEVPAEAIGPFGGAPAPTWDGLRTVLSRLRHKHLGMVDLPKTQSPTVMLSHLLRELAEVFAGHRGPRPELGIAAAGSDIDGSQVRFEIECITWLLAGRLGLKIAARGSLRGYLKDGDLMPPVSRDRVLHTVNAIEKLFGGALAFGETIREDVPSLFSSPTQLAI